MKLSYLMKSPLKAHVWFSMITRNVGSIQRTCMHVGLYLWWCCRKPGVSSKTGQADREGTSSRNTGKLKTGDSTRIVSSSDQITGMALAHSICGSRKGDCNGRQQCRNGHRYNRVIDSAPSGSGSEIGKGKEGTGSGSVLNQLEAITFGNTKGIAGAHSDLVVNPVATCCEEKMGFMEGEQTIAVVSDSCFSSNLGLDKNVLQLRPPLSKKCSNSIEEGEVEIDRDNQGISSDLKSDMDMGLAFLADLGIEMKSGSSAGDTLIMGLNSMFGLGPGIRKSVDLGNAREVPREDDIGVDSASDHDVFMEENKARCVANQKFRGFKVKKNKRSRQLQGVWRDFALM